MRRLSNIEKKQREELVIEKCKQMGYEVITPFVYTNNRAVIHLKCMNDNYEWYTKYFYFITQKSGCPKCGGRYKPSQKEAKEKIYKRCEEIDAKLSKSFNYKTNKTKIHLICNKDNHSWDVSYDSFIYYKTGCPKCSRKAKRTQKEADIAIKQRCCEENYSLTSKYIHRNNKSVVHLKCNKDGYEWYPTLYSFLYNRSGCPKCSGKLKPSPEEINIMLHNRCTEEDCYLVNEFKYVNRNSKIYLKCNKDGHKWNSLFANFIYKKTGCPICNQSKLEKEVALFLETNNIVFERQTDKKHFEWLGKQSLDFFLPEYNIAIECQGIQHFKPIRYFENEKYNFKYTWELDITKFKLCQENGIKLLYYARPADYLPETYHSKLFTSLNELLIEILK